MKKRQDLAGSVAAIKEEKNLPIAVPKIERQLETHMRNLGLKMGLDDSLTRSITELLLDASKTYQREILFKKKIHSFLHEKQIKRVCVVGAGRMGGWFASYFRSFGEQVFLFDKDLDFVKKRARELQCNIARDMEAVLESDLIILAIPISETRRGLANLSEALQRSKKKDSNRAATNCKAIIEVSSLKGKLPDLVLSRESIVPIISIHPLFGPSAKSFAKNCMFVTVSSKSKRGGGNALSFTRGLFPQFNLLKIDKKEHDMQMALMLSLPHAIALAFANVILRNRRLLKSNEMRTPSYSVLRDFASKVVLENPQIYYEIQSKNKFTPHVLQDLVKSIETIQHSFKRGGGRNEFETLFQRARNNLI